MFEEKFILKSITLSLIILSFMLSAYLCFTNYKFADFFNMKLFVILPLTIIFHELLHMIGLSLYNLNFKNINFGISKWGLPYTRINRFIPKNYFLIATIMPLFFLGILPLIYTLIDFNKNIITLTLINISGSSGDILIFLKKIKQKKD